VTTQSLVSGNDAQNLNFAVPASEVAKLLRKCSARAEVIKFPLSRPDPIAERLEAIKPHLRVGARFTAAELEKIMGGPADKFEPIVSEGYIPEFKKNNVFLSHVRRYYPFEVPGMTKPLYRVNLLFQDLQDGKGTQLTSWYFRSPD
jgi:hypothetical protein